MIECSILNRLRGTGDVLRVGGFRVTGIMLYALYLMVVVTMISEWYYGLAFVVLFVAGESYAWGKWIGYLVDYEDEHSPEYASKVGKSFPYIHYVANAIVNERVNYLWYCRVALALRGFVWWYPLYVLFAFAGLIGYTEALVIGVVLGIAFPVACWIGIKIKAEGKIWIVNYSRGWENQELVYGLIQGMCLWYVIIGVVYG
mgnify:CR=1 FL=1